MWATNLKVGAVVIGTLALYTGLANTIPQVQSEVPKQLTLGADVTPEQLAAAGQELYNGAGGCTACHGLGERAPNLLTDERGTGQIGARCGTRQPGKDCKVYLHEALVEPAEFVAPGYQPIMPDMSKTLSPQQVWALVAFLESQGGTITVTAADLPAEGHGPEEEEAGGSGGGFAGGSTEPVTMLRDGGCFGCHQLGEEGASLGPNFDHVGGRASAAQIRESILDPDAKVAAGYENFKGMMPKGLGDQMTATQLEALVRFLAGRK
jgi:mono/diheme cytochrome c family protein